MALFTRDLDGFHGFIPLIRFVTWRWSKQVLIDEWDADLADVRGIDFSDGFLPVERRLHVNSACGHLFTSGSILASWVANFCS